MQGTTVKFSTATKCEKGTVLDRKDGIGKGASWRVLKATEARYRNQWDVEAVRVLPVGGSFFVQRRHDLIYFNMPMKDGVRLPAHCTGRKAHGDDRGIITDTELLNL